MKFIKAFCFWTAVMQITSHRMTSQHAVNLLTPNIQWTDETFISHVLDSIPDLVLFRWPPLWKCTSMSINRYLVCICTGIQMRCESEIPFLLAKTLPPPTIRNTHSVCRAAPHAMTAESWWYGGDGVGYYYTSAAWLVRPTHYTADMHSHTSLSSLPSFPVFHQRTQYRTAPLGSLLLSWSWPSGCLSTYSR